MGPGVKFDARMPVFCIFTRKIRFNLKPPRHAQLAIHFQKHHIDGHVKKLKVKKKKIIIFFYIYLIWCEQCNVINL